MEEKKRLYIIRGVYMLKGKGKKKFPRYTQILGMAFRW